MVQPSSVGFWDTNHTWGLVSIDWTVARDVWFAQGRGHQDCEATSIEGCRRLKVANKATRCFIYHNMELALEWEESQRKVMYDPSKADYFLQYTDGKGNKNGVRQLVSCPRLLAHQPRYIKSPLRRRRFTMKGISLATSNIPV